MEYRPWLNLRRLLVAGTAWLASVVSFGCRCEEDTAQPKGPSTAARTLAAPSASAPTLAVKDAKPRTLLGNALALSPGGERLLAGMLDDRALSVVPLPLGTQETQRVDLPGHPGQIVAGKSHVFVTVRDPSLLWIGRPTLNSVREVARIDLPADAWGLVLSHDEKTAYVTSAWSSFVSAVDLVTRKVRWTLPVAREPRGLALSEANQRLYVSHLVGHELTLVDLNAPEPVANKIELPASALRTPKQEALHASLGYSLVLNPSGSRLFAPRHALGALGKNAWFGAATVDVLLTSNDKPFAPKRLHQQPGQRSTLAKELISGGDTQLPGTGLTPFTQPRAAVYRSTTNTLLVAGEGDDRIAELDALAPDPTLAVIRHYQLGTEYHPKIRVARAGAAPSGLVLSADESRLWVYCRGTNDLAEVLLGTSGGDRTKDPVTARLTLGEDPLGPGGATGRKLFYNSTDSITSGGLGCAGCHPEGRDDGHVWHEARFLTEDGETQNFTGSVANIPQEAQTRGFPRRTPMLAGRVIASGPYGWHAESKTLEDREVAGFGLHRWGAVPSDNPDDAKIRARALADFLRRGLHPPAKSAAIDSALVQRGSELFFSKETQCSECHVASTSYTTRQAYPLPPLPQQSAFDKEEDQRFKIPSLLHLAGRAPYFHDGSAPSLEALIEQNADRMGKTRHLSAADRTALVAFLRTL